MVGVAAASGDTAVVFIETGAVVVGLAFLARIADRARISAVPLYVVAGLAVGEGGLAPLDVSDDFIRLVGDIGALLLLLMLGLAYSPEELRTGLASGIGPGVVNGVVNFVPGLAIGLILGWDIRAAFLLGGVCWVSSSGVVAKVLADLGRLGNRETPAVLNLLVLEDLAMAVFLPVAGGVVTGGGVAGTASAVIVATGAVLGILTVALRWGLAISALLSRVGDEALLLAVIGATLLVGGIAEQLRVSAAIGAFLLGLMVSGPVQERVAAAVRPLRDLFAAIFFLLFAFPVRPAEVAGALGWASALASVGIAGKFVSGWVAARSTAGPIGRLRAGAVLVARGEFSVVIASLGAELAEGDALRATTVAYVLLTTIAGPLLARWSDRLVSTGGAER